jgi:IMP dehydrogenase/GMP reductase
MNPALTYDDITLIPQFSAVSSRKNIDLTTQLSRRYKLRIPIIASPMDTVCESEMAIALAELGGAGCIHRFMNIEEQSTNVRLVWNVLYDVDGYYTGYKDITKTDYHRNDAPVMAAIGANGDYLERAQELVKAGANVILIDVAHGHHANVRDALSNLKKNLPDHVDIIAGNVATEKAAVDLVMWGADALRVGVGGGSLCTTRVKTGFGIPNVTSLKECARHDFWVCEDHIPLVRVPIMADGGIRSSGDIAKALAVGAQTVMLGSLLAGTKESPGTIIEKPNGLYKRYRGAASLETKSVHGQETRNVEGESTIVPFKGGVKFVIDGLLDGVRSAFSYAGADSMSTYHPEYITVTHSGTIEARPHLL